MTVGKNNGPKIVKINKIQKVEEIKIEFTEEELIVKEKLQEIDRKVESIRNIVSTIQTENADTMFFDEVVENIIALTAMTAATDLIGQHFGLEKLNLNEYL
jgi:uncharacterized protein YcbK (DUF882 family)